MRITRSGWIIDFRRGIKPTSAEWVNVLEESMSDEPAVNWTEGQDGVALKVKMNRFEIKTLRIEV